MHSVHYHGGAADYADDMPSTSGLLPDGKGHRKGGAFPDGAVHHNGSLMIFDDLAYNVESHA